MITIKTACKIVPFAIAIICFTCSEKSSSPGKGGTFHVRVIDTAGNPIAGAIIEGGLDWDSFRVTTDIQGRALLPGVAFDVRATIRKNNYFSIIDNDLRPKDYVLTPTPYVLTELGEIAGDLIKFDFFKILTITYQGQYRVYSFDGDSVAEMAVVEFPPAVKEFKLFGNILWYTTHNSGVYVYSLNDPLNPIQLCHLDISGYLKPFDVQDSLIAVGPTSGSGPVRVFSYNIDGSISELDDIGDFYVSTISFYADYLFTLINYYGGLSVFDISDPTDIRLVHNTYYSGYNYLFLRGDSLVLRGTSGNAGSGMVGYQMIDLSDPENPEFIYGFSAKGRIDNIVDDTTAVGSYYFDYKALCVFKRTEINRFETVAIVSEFYGYSEHHGCLPPYYLIGDRLWKMEQR